jgi:hypothetical protein
MLGRPEPQEAAPYYFTYIDAVAGDDPLSILQIQLETCPETVRHDLPTGLSAFLRSREVDHSGTTPTRDRYGARLRLSSALVCPRFF